MPAQTYLFRTSRNDDIEVIENPGTGNGIVFLGGMNTGGMLANKPGGMSAAIRKYLMHKAEKENVRLTYINWQAPANGTVTEFRENLMETFNHVSGGKPQVIAAHCYGADMAALLARGLEKNGQKDRVAGMVFVSPSFDGMRLAARVIGAENRALLAADPNHCVVIADDTPFPLQQRHLDDGEKNLVIGDGSIPAPAVPTHIYHHTSGKEYVPLRVSQDYVQLAQGHATLETIGDNRSILTRAFLNRFWDKAKQMSAAAPAQPGPAPRA